MARFHTLYNAIELRGPIEYGLPDPKQSRPRLVGHMPYLKLWPHARPWRLAHPQPMLRCVPQAAFVAGLTTRAVAATAQKRIAPSLTPAQVLAA